MAFKGQRTTTTTEVDELDNTQGTNSEFPPETDDDNPSTDWLDSEEGASSDDSAAYKQLNPPRGDWIKKERFTVKTTLIEGDSLPGDKDPNGRIVITFTGKPEIRLVDGAEYQPFLVMSISPDKRTFEKDDGTSDLDSKYKLWLEASQDLFLSIYGRKWKKPSEVVRMLELDEYTINTYQGSNGPAVAHVKPLRKKRN